MAFRLETYNINYLCTDYYDVYSKYKISKTHVMSKAETCLVEAKNSSKCIVYVRVVYLSLIILKNF